MREERTAAIFLSCGTPDNEAQEAFLAAVEAYLETHDCEPQTVGRSKFTGRQPVQAARDLIGSCDGALVIAFERTRIVTGIERPDSNAPQPIGNESHPTIWNQMEAAMAYAQRVPILTLVQPGLKRQGMLSTRLEWVALEKELTPSILLSKEFCQCFDEWLGFVRDGMSSISVVKPSNVQDLSIGSILSSLKPAQLYALLSALALIISSLATVSYKLGQWSNDADHEANHASKK